MDNKAIPVGAKVCIYCKKAIKNGETVESVHGGLRFAHRECLVDHKNSKKNKAKVALEARNSGG